MKKLLIISLAVTNCVTWINPAITKCQINYTHETNTNNQTSTNIVKEIANDFETNLSKKINYSNLLNTISNNSFLTKLSENINIFNGSLLANKYGYPKITERNIFILNGINYEIFLKHDKTPWNSFLNAFTKQNKAGIIDTIVRLLTISVISEIAHYYSVNENAIKISDSINVVKELIQDLNKDSNINKNGQFMTKLQSWNLEKIISDYQNKVFTNEIDKYRTIDYTNLKTASTVDFEPKIISEIDNMKLDTTYNHDWWSNIETYDSNGTATVYQAVNMINNSGNLIFNIIFQENLTLNIHSFDNESLRTIMYDTTKLQFSDLNQFDIEPIF